MREFCAFGLVDYVPTILLNDCCHVINRNQPDGPDVTPMSWRYPYIYLPGRFLYRKQWKSAIEEHHGYKITIRHFLLSSIGGMWRRITIYVSAITIVASSSPVARPVAVMVAICQVGMATGRIRGWGEVRSLPKMSPLIEVWLKIIIPRWRRSAA